LKQIAARSATWGFSIPKYWARQRERDAGCFQIVNSNFLKMALA